MGVIDDGEAVVLMVGGGGCGWGASQEAFAPAGRGLQEQRGLSGSWG